MKTLREAYPERTESVDGYEAGPGAIYTFTQGDRAYRFDVSEGSKYATSLPSVVGGREVTLMVHVPNSETSAVLQIPKECLVFQAALVSLQKLGVRYVRFFSQPTGSFKDFDLAALQSA